MSSPLRLVPIEARLEADFCQQGTNYTTQHYFVFFTVKKMAVNQSDNELKANSF